MERELLKQVITDQQEYNPPNIFFDRALIQTIRRFVEDPSIMIISGIRRSGKATIQRQLQRTCLSTSIDIKKQNFFSSIFLIFV